MAEDLTALLGAVQSPTDSRDYDITSLLTPDQQAAPLPARFWTSPFPPRIDQEGGTCTAASTTLMRFQQQRKDLGVWVPLSYKDLYRHQKQIDGINGEGSTLRAAMRVLKGYGQGITTAGGGNPAKNRISAYYAIPRNVEAIKRAIYTYGAVVVAGPWAKEWMRTDDSGVLSDPRNLVGGHAICLIGWDDASGRKGFGIDQTWPLPWGYKGKGIGFYPYDIVADSEWGLWEAWRAVDLAG